MNQRNNMYDVIYRLRKRAGIKIDTRKRIILFEYQNPTDEAAMKRKAVLRLCREFGFVRQAEIV